MRARGRHGGGGAEGGRVRSQRLCSEEERGNIRGEKKRRRSMSEHLCYNVIGLDVKQVM